MTFKRSVLALLVMATTLMVAPVSARASVNTLYVSVPGPLDGCTSSSVNSSDFSVAVGDLLFPSAFINGPQDQPQGSGVAIASAELNSISPETVNYTISSGLKWSNGKPFSVDDLISWWQRSKAIPSVTTEGYRAITSMTVSSDAKSVVATFAKPFANWPSLFRDVQYPGVTLDCRLSNLSRRPTLGYYVVSSVSKHQIVLVKSSQLRSARARYGRVIISDLLPTFRHWASNFVGEVPSVSAQSISSISGIQQLRANVVASTNLVQLGFSAHRINMSLPAFREALGVSVNRQIMVNSIYGAATLSVKPAPLLFFTQHSSSSIASKYFAPSDCLTCALEALHRGKYSQAGGGWKDSHGKDVSLRMVIGPSAADHAAANFIVNTWRVIGIPVFQVSVNTEAKVSAALAAGSADVGISTRSVTFGPFVPARSFFGAVFADSRTQGLQSTAISNLGQVASSDLNPNSSALEWAALDSAVTHSFLARPLFFQPTIQAWSSRFTTFVGSGSVISLFDQIPSLRP